MDKEIKTAQVYEGLFQKGYMEEMMKTLFDWVENEDKSLPYFHDGVLDDFSDCCRLQIGDEFEVNWDDSNGETLETVAVVANVKYSINIDNGETIQWVDLREVYEDDEPE